MNALLIRFTAGSWTHNHHWQFIEAPSVGTVWAYLETTAWIIYFSGIKLFWFQDRNLEFLFLFSFFLLVVWLSRNFVGFHEILFQTYAEKQKSFIPRKKGLWQELTGFNIETTSFVDWPNFQRRFWLNYTLVYKNSPNMTWGHNELKLFLKLRSFTNSFSILLRNYEINLIVCVKNLF